MLEQAPAKVDYRGLEVCGMAPYSSGGTTIGKALDILENFGLSALGTPAALPH